MISFCLRFITLSLALLVTFFASRWTCNKSSSLRQAFWATKFAMPFKDSLHSTRDKQSGPQHFTGECDDLRITSPNAYFRCGIPRLGRGASPCFNEKVLCAGKGLKPPFKTVTPPPRHNHAKIRYRHIWLFCVPVLWCASAYIEDDLAGESWYTGKVCLYRDCACIKCACIEYLLYCIYSIIGLSVQGVLKHAHM